jgi:glycogen debranching enzyme
VVENFKPHLAEAGLGSISEIFDADPPHLPRGCFAQAWSVGECIRVILDYQLFEAPEKKKKMTASAKRGARSQKKNARELVTI